MNIKIKFRGKKVENGEWVYGSLVETNKDNKAFILDCDFSEIATVWNEKETRTLSSDHLKIIEVDPKTVGQFSGVLFNPKTEIYEGDIIGHETLRPKAHLRKGIVKFENGCFDVFWQDGHVDELYSIKFRNMGFLGSIHDEENKTLDFSD